MSKIYPSMEVIVIISAYCIFFFFKMKKRISPQHEYYPQQKLFFCFFCELIQKLELVL